MGDPTDVPRRVPPRSTSVAGARPPGRDAGETGRDSGRTPASYCHPVHISYILRVRHNGLRAGSFTGEIESVATGHSFPLGSLSHLEAYVLETADEDAAALGGHRHAALEGHRRAALEP